ncbi:glutathione peroxidase [Elioraea sp.]|uniref:glutathione peroxidase n=1 Tax=Elioraea sp. TaxID=2185103 RepID=UPI0021DDA9EB|nr:glutathione peroxidase [Elioraea sp.]GIX11433.1 MAG: glutathione peroxidase [Elioraea sp.]
MVDRIRRVIGALGALGLALAPFRPDRALAEANTAWDFTFTSIEGEAMPLARWRGRPLLVVNTASFCGFTPQYAALQALWERYEPRGLVVVGVPSNDFRQEQADNAAVKRFCEVEFGVTFPLAEISRVTGREAHPFYRWAAAAAGPPRWNFHKYLVDRAGRIAGAWGARTAPDSPDLIAAIEAALAVPPPSA